jgi:hypothetical protein
MAANSIQQQQANAALASRNVHQLMLDRYGNLVPLSRMNPQPPPYYMRDANGNLIQTNDKNAALAAGQREADANPSKASMALGLAGLGLSIAGAAVSGGLFEKKKKKSTASSILGGILGAVGGALAGAAG